MLSLKHERIDPINANNSIEVQGEYIKQGRRLLELLRRSAADVSIQRYAVDRKSFLHEAECLLKGYEKATLVAAKKIIPFSNTERRILQQFYDNGLVALSLSHGLKAKELIEKESLDVQETFSEFVELYEHIAKDFKLNYSFIIKQFID